MSDVTALVLSLGEYYTERAISSVQRQTLAAAEIIVIQGISPFHRAFNAGVSRVRTEFFIQVDADMILDDTCIGELRNCVSDGVGMVIGHLRDPLVCRDVGIKLFRTECFKNVKLRDSISSETDSVEDILRAGWTILYALKYSASRAGLHTFGEHRPDYQPYYAFSRYVLIGAKCRYRKAGNGLRSLFRRLQTNAHSAAIFALIGAAHGIFVREKRDLHGPYTLNEEFEFLERFLRVHENGEKPPALTLNLVGEDLRKGFKTFFNLGIWLRRDSASSIFMTHMRELHQQDGIASWVALVGLCHGLFVEKYREAEAEEAFALLSEILPG